MELEREELYFKSARENADIFMRIWKDKEATPRFILQIVHGMCEYIDRYDDFAKFICENGGLVCGNDHLGHGKSSNGVYGYFAKKDGEKLVLQDVHTATQTIKKQYPDVPLILLGHSMGSLLARKYMSEYGDEAAGAVFMGTSGANPLTGLIRFLANVGIFFGRAKKPATFLSHLAFSKYNDRYDNVKSENDWLTRDRAMVNKYNADALCTFKFTDRAAYDMANLVDSVSGEKWANSIPKEKPYLITSGSMDPVGNYTAGVQEVYDWVKKAGVSDVTLKFYEGARHEILNESNRQEVYADVLAWIKSKI
ncbi:MAG: alpha/beta fold hydrolase [Christensenellaceae bacterium]